MNLLRFRLICMRFYVYFYAFPCVACLNIFVFMRTYVFLQYVCVFLHENYIFSIFNTGCAFWVGSVTFHLVAIWSKVLQAK